jgi:hypothetical protein
MKLMRREVRSAWLGEDAGDLTTLVNPEAVQAIRAAALTALHIASRHTFAEQGSRSPNVPWVLRAVGTVSNKAQPRCGSPLAATRSGFRNGEG